MNLLKSLFLHFSHSIMPQWSFIYALSRIEALNIEKDHY